MAGTSKTYVYVRRNTDGDSLTVYYKFAEFEVEKVVQPIVVPPPAGTVPPEVPQPLGSDELNVAYNYRRELGPADVAWLTENVDGYVELVKAQEAAAKTDATAQAATEGLRSNPHDPRMVFTNSFGEGETSAGLIYSFSANAALPLVDGFILTTPGENNTKVSKAAHAMDEDELGAHPDIAQFRGVPAIMNPHAYIGFQQFKASKDKAYLSRLIDQENEPRWYEIDEANSERAHRYKSPTVSELVAWSNEAANSGRTPYRFQDFAYCKYWQKIPNNYLITLRRYPFPTVDNLEAAGEGRSDGEKYGIGALQPAAQAITWLGETTGNKISALLGGIESGLNWKNIEAGVNSVSPGSPGSAGAGPAPGLAKWIGLIAGENKTLDNKVSTAAAPDPYNEGPWNNKVIGGLNVINSVKARERGLKFEHKISLVFEYEARSIGGINTKAAMLDIMSNLLVLTSTTATFWGGQNRYRPGSGGDTAPFLGGKAGRAAWMKGDPVAFLDAVTKQFTAAADAIGDFFANALADPVGAIKSLIAGGASSFMKNNAQNNGSPGSPATGMKAILTGEPVGEWHVTVGNPFNPMMLIGNLICTGVKFDFNEELGPDDFPTELKATITLEHGMPRDRDGIESMFNGGGGRLYSLPTGYEKSFSSASMTAVDKFTKTKGSGGSSSGGGQGGGQGGGVGGGGKGAVAFRRKHPLLGDEADFDRGVKIITDNKYFKIVQKEAKAAGAWIMGFSIGGKQAGK